MPYQKNLYTDEFKETEINKLKNTRNTMIGFLITVNTIIMFIFIYLFYAVYKERGLTEPSFVIYILPVMLQLQAVLAVFIGGSIWLSKRRFDLFINTLRQLDGEHTNLYQSYITKLMRIAGAGIAPYVFERNALVVPRLLSNKEVSYPAIIHAISSREWRGNPAQYRIRLNCSDGKKYSFAFTQEHQLDFLLENIRQRNPSARFEQKKRSIF